MFDSVMMRSQAKPQTDQPPLDLGFLAEAMLFYRDVHLVADQTMLRQLTQAFTPEILLEYMRCGFILLRYHPQTPIVMTNTRDGRAVYDLGMVSAEHTDIYQSAVRIFTAVTQREGRGRRFAKQFCDLAESVSIAGEVSAAARDDATDEAYTRSTLSALLPDTENVGDILRVERIGSGELVAYSSEALLKSGLTVENVLGRMLEVRVDLHFAAQLGSELATSAANSTLAAARLTDVLRKREVSDSAMTLFQQYALQGVPAVGEALRMGRYTFADLLPILQASFEFRNWLRDKEPDEDLAKAYVAEVAKVKGLEKLPAKLVRFSLFAVAGAAIGVALTGPIGIAAGVALGAADFFLVDRLVKGWRPNQFIEEKVKPLLRE